MVEARRKMKRRISNRYGVPQVLALSLLFSFARHCWSQNDFNESRFSTL